MFLKSAPMINNENKKNTINTVLLMSAIFLFLSLFGIYCTFYLVQANGTNALIHDSIAAAKLPNSDVSLRTVYTGINPLDRIITYIVVLLWPVTELENTLLTLHTTTFLAGANAIWTLLLLEGYRRGNQKTVSSL